MLRESVAFIQSLYPEEHAHRYKLRELLSDGSRFIIARYDGVAIGCGAYVWHADHQVEIKHMYVSPASRGLGCGRALLREIEVHACHDHVVRIVLETSKKQVEAIRLYASFGYTVCEPYTEHHAEDIFMMKFLEVPQYTDVDYSLEME